MASVKEKVTSKPVKEHEQSYNKILRTLVDNAQLSTNPTFPIPIETCCDQCCPETGLVSPEELVDIVRQHYPNGHPDFVPTIMKEIALHSKKNHDYASGGNPLGNFNRVAKVLEMYPNLKLSNPAVVALVYMMKQLDAVLWMLSNGHTAQVEGIAERMQDVSVYSKLVPIINKEYTESVQNVE